MEDVRSGAGTGDAAEGGAAIIWIAFLDVQKLFSLAFEDGKTRKSLEHAIDFLELEKDIPFHRALSDASYTARIFTGILKCPFLQFLCLQMNQPACNFVHFRIYHRPDKLTELSQCEPGMIQFYSADFNNLKGI